MYHGLQSTDTILSFKILWYMYRFDKITYMYKHIELQSHNFYCIEKQTNFGGGNAYFTERFELRHEKTNILHMRKQRRRSASH